MGLGSRVRRARGLKRYSQKELAARLDVGRSAVANWECGAKVPSSQRLLHLALVTGVSYEWLATGRGCAELGDQWIPAVQGEVVDDPNELMLLQAFRACGTTGRRAVLELLAGLTGAARPHMYVSEVSVQRLRLRARVRALGTDASAVDAGQG